MASGLPSPSTGVAPGATSAPHPPVAPGRLTPKRTLIVVTLLLCALLLGARLHDAWRRAESQGAIALSVIEQGPAMQAIAPGAAPPMLGATEAVGLALAPMEAILSMEHCQGSRCNMVHERPGVPRCQAPLAWPALCVSVPSALEPLDTLKVAYDLRPTLLQAGAEVAVCLALMATVGAVWRRARNRQRSADLVPAPRLREAAETDALTGLLNRVAFETALQRHNEGLTHNTQDTDGCLMYFDLDRFKLINDTHGHIAGDQVLKAVAQRLRYTLGGGVLLGRLGGDEFAALLTDVSSRANIETICRVLIEQVTKPIQIGDVKEWVGLSIGAYMLKRGELNLGEMLHRADLAMYEAKRAGRGRLVFYDDSMDRAARSRAQVQADLKKAIEERQFFMVYQPQFDRHDRIRGVESMVRWRHPTRGLIPPQEFIPVAEKTGLIVPLGKMVLDMVCADLAALRAERLPLPYVSLDVSLRQLADVTLVQVVQDVLSKHGLGPNDLEFEVSESTAMVGHVDKENETLKTLSGLSFRIAIDGFGTGYSSMTRLLDLKVDKLKIDARFIECIGQPHFNPALLELMISLASRLGVKSVAEGVQTLEQVVWLRQAGCQMLQGDFYTLPMNRMQLLDWLRKQEGDDGFDGGIWAPTQVMEECAA